MLTEWMGTEVTWARRKDTLKFNRINKVAAFAIRE